MQEKWRQRLNETDFDVKIPFILLHRNIKDTSLKAFQFKIIHRILPTNKLLHQMNIINYNSCNFCRTHLETLEHFLFECNHVKNIWLLFYNELGLRHKFDNLIFDLKTILFGYDCQSARFTSGINIFILLVKAYVFSCKTRNQNINYEAAKKYIKYHSEIHKSLTKNKEAEWFFWMNGYSMPHRIEI